MNDLQVIQTSDALSGSCVDLVISGSIAAVESVKFIRSLRRLGAKVTPWLTSGGASFITPLSVSWAANSEAIVSFSGVSSHIFSGNAVVVAPASSNFLAKIAIGVTNCHASALVASALGQNKPVIILPAMHDSLGNAPMARNHLAKIASFDNVHLIEPRVEEGKLKFPEPMNLADQVSHVINQPSRNSKPVLVTMGTTRGYIDDVRYISNYSSGKLGTLISEELYRQGFSTTVVTGPCEFKPKTSSKIIPVLTTGDMLAECQNAEEQGVCGGVFCASVLDYEPDSKVMGKIKSGSKNYSVSFKNTPKIIENIKLVGMPKIGFKLETGLSVSSAKTIAETYIEKYNLTMLIANELSTVTDSSHHAWAFSKTGSTIELHSKDDIAKLVTKHFM